MNQLFGKIIDCQTDGALTLIRTQVESAVISAIVIDNPEKSDYLTIGKTVRVVCKETEVVLAKELGGTISLQNQLNCTVIDFEIGKLLCKVNLQFHQNTLSSVITRTGFDQLQIQKNDKIIALIKTNEITLAPYD